MAQQKLLEQLEREIEKLKISRDLDSQTSSKPPSTDLLKKPENAKIDPEKVPSDSLKRKPGGQPGHQGQTRKGFSRTDRIEILQPLKCNHCGQRKFLTQPVKVDTQQVAQLVEQPIEVVEYHRYHCQGVKEWLWVFTNPDFCLFRAGDTRSRAELIAVLGSEYSGVLSSDDFNVYNGYAVRAQQKCLAHLRRHFKRLLKLPGKYNQVIGQTFLDLIDQAFKHYRDWQLTRNELSYRTWGKEFKNQIQQRLKQYSQIAGYEAGKLLRSLKEKAGQWWYFLEHPEVPPDNNLAERSLRLAVTKRKVSGGSRSMKRFEHTANLLTVVQTCRRQKRSVILNSS